ncbi:hypothetical protein [Neisseria sicca]
MMKILKAIFHDHKYLRGLWITLFCLGALGYSMNIPKAMMYLVPTTWYSLYIVTWLIYILVRVVLSTFREVLDFGLVMNLLYSSAFFVLNLNLGVTLNYYGRTEFQISDPFGVFFLICCMAVNPLTRMIGMVVDYIAAKIEHKFAPPPLGIAKISRSEK